MRNLRGRTHHTESGFALTELLVVIMIIGTLAGMAFPAFLSHKDKGSDADAKSNARNAVSAIESCFVERRDYTACDTAEELESAGAKLTTAVTDTASKLKGAISVTATADTYTVVGYSGSKNNFEITKTPDGTYSRSCGTGGSTSCKMGDSW